MRVLKSLIFSVLAYAIGTHAVDSNSEICSCTTCCNVANETSTHFTGKSIVEFTYPKVSLEGTYTIVGHRYDDGNARRLVEVVDSLPYQYVVKYENDFKTAFDRNIFVFANAGANLNCTESHLYYGNPVDTTYKKIDFVKHETEDYCTLDINYILTRDEIAYTDEIYFAFNYLVDENSEFHIMYDMSPQGLIVPVTDIIEYPYVIHDGTVEANDVNEASAFYVNVSLNVFDIGAADISELNTTGCLTPDEIMATEAYWITKTGGKCPVEILSNGVGDQEVSPGRNYQLRIDQEDYQNCAVKDVELVGTDLVFTFRLELPRSYADTATNEGDGCYYFAENENVQNITISMSQDVTSTIDTAFISNFNTRVASVLPDQETKCSDGSIYPTPHAQIKFTIEATFPGTFGSDFSTVTLPELEGLTVEWDTVTGAQPATIPCTDYAGEAGSEDDYKVCQFNLRTVVCEPIYQTNDGECAFERNNTRLLTGFIVVEEMPGGQTATYPSSDLNLGLDHSTFDISYCQAAAEDAPISVTDVFNVELDLQNYYHGFPVDWTETNNYTMNQDMIARLSVGQIASSPFNFDDDLELMIKVVTIELSNPVTNDIITSYTWSVSDKKDFMSYSWTPYHSDPRFCTWYNSAATDKCEKFFVDGTRSNTFHDATWITNVMPYECQEVGTVPADVDTNNYDYFLFTPREWFQDNAKGLVDMKITVTGVIHKCSNNPSRLLDAVREGKIRGSDGRELQSVPDPDVDILYITDELIISFVTNDDGSSDLDIASTPPKSWLSENKTLVIVAGVLGGVVVLGIFIIALTRGKETYGILVGSHTGPDF